MLLTAFLNKVLKNEISLAVAETPCGRFDLTPSTSLRRQRLWTRRLAWQQTPAPGDIGDADAGRRADCVGRT